MTAYSDTIRPRQPGTVLHGFGKEDQLILSGGSLAQSLPCQKEYFKANWI